MNIQEIMEVQGQPTLKAIAAVLEVPAQRIYSVAKQPKEGEIFDPKVYNWEAIERFVTRRLGKDNDFATIEDVVAAALLKDEEFKVSDGRHAPRGTAVIEKITVDGVEIPVRKYKNFEMESDKLVCLRKDANVYKIIMQTASHTVLRAVAENGEFCSESVKVISNGMLNMRGAGPAALDEQIAKRFSGEYAKELAAEAQKAADEAAAKVPADAEN